MIVFRSAAFAFFAIAMVCPGGFGQVAQPHAAADLGQAVLQAGLDAGACYRVRDLEIDEEDVQYYLTDGYLIFGKPVNGAPISAVFSGEVEAGDGEVILLPPNRAERRTLSSYTHSPNLDEHFVNAVFLFTESRARALEGQMPSNAEAKLSPEAGAVLAERWTPVIANLAANFESRIVLDLLSLDLNNDTTGRKGFLAAAIQGKKLGTFNVGYDGRGADQINAGQFQTRDGQGYWDTWTSFADKSHRGVPPSEPEEQILSYRIDATLDSSLMLHCITRMRIRATADSRNAIPFDLSGEMRATGATIDGVPAEVYSRDSARSGLNQNSGDELLIVTPARPLEPGSEHEVEIRHEGRVVKDTGHQVYFVTSRGTWYPNRQAQFATYDVTYRYPKTLDLVAAGQIREDRTDGDMRITRRVPSGRIRLMGFNLGVYDSKILERGGIQIEVSANHEVEDALRTRTNRTVDVPALPTPPFTYGRGRPVPRGLTDDTLTALPETLTATASPSGQLTQIAGEVASAMDFYRARFGDPPVSRIEVSPLPGRFGQGFAGMIYLATLSYLPTTVRPLSLMPTWEQVFYGELLRAHEAAHQWWGNVVFSSGYRHEWLMEALANYSALMYLESRHGAKFIEDILSEYRRELLARGPDGETTESEGPVTDGRRLESSNNPRAWNAIAYGKGTWIIHMLRRRMGDAQFTKMLTELRRRYEWKSIDTEQFRLLCAEFAPKNADDPKLENFFDQWVYGTGMPDFKLQYSVKGKPGALKLTGTVTQSGVKDDFSAMVPVEIQTGRGKIVREIRTSSEPVAFSIPVAVPNAKAVLDPGSNVLRR